MKKLLILLPVVFILVGFSTVAQTQKRKLTKAERKALVAARNKAEYQQVYDLITNKRFVLEAGYLRNQYGYRQQVNSMINFIKIDSAEAVLQVGNDFGYGYNGLGGITLEGKITHWKLTEDTKRLTLTLNINVMTNIGTYFITIYAGSGDRAEAVVTGMSGGKLYYTGQLKGPENSRIFKGSSVIY